MTTNTADTQHSADQLNREITGFVPRQDELMALVKHWVKRAIEDEYFIFWGQCFGSSDFRRIDFYWHRVNEIARILGDAETDRAVAKAYEEMSQGFGPDRGHWIVFRYGTREERTAFQDQGGQFLEDFEPGVAEEVARKTVQRVFRDGAPKQQQALMKDLLVRYARKLQSYKPDGGHFFEIFGIWFPNELRSLILSTGAEDPDPQPNGFFGAISLERGKAFLAKLDEIAKEGDGALKALVAGV
jgi:hypothetical protein